MKTQFSSNSVRPRRLTVVVPTRDSERTLARCLESVLSQSYGDVELIVVDNSSTDTTVEIAKRLEVAVVCWGPERSAQRNRGAALSTGEFLLFLDSDLNLESGVVEEAVSHFADTPELGALVIPERAFGEGFWASCRELEKRLYLGDPHTEAARVFRRSAFEEVGGFDESLTGSEDWDLADRVEQAGYRVGRVESFAHHDEGRLRPRETFAKKLYYGRHSSGYLARAGKVGLRHFMRTALIARPGMLLRHPHRAVGLMVLKLVEAAGFMAGVLTRPRR